MNEGATHAQEPRFVVERDFQVPVLVALLYGGEEMLAAIFHPLDRPAQKEACGGERYLFG